MKRIESTRMSDSLSRALWIAAGLATLAECGADAADGTSPRLALGQLPRNRAARRHPFPPIRGDGVEVSRHGRAHGCVAKLVEHAQAAASNSEHKQRVAIFEKSIWSDMVAGRQKWGGRQK
jgi:hypothetical protein